MSPFKKFQSNLNTYYTKFKGTPIKIIPMTQKNGLSTLQLPMISFLFKELSSFFKRSIPCGISLTNRHSFILDGHGFHVTLKAIEQAQAFGLYMIIIPSHMSHAL
jgi:hypothetical protein